MKRLILSSLLLATVFAACNNNKDTYVPPQPGVVVDSMAMPAEGGGKAIFAVAIVVDSDKIRPGLYDVRALYDTLRAEGKFSMPKGGEKYKPEVRKGKDPFQFIVGFRVPGDTTFYEYFEAVAQRSKEGNERHTTIGMKYLKSYSFE